MKPSSEEKKKIPIWEFALPIILFLSSGIIDTLTTFVNKNIIKNDDAISNSYLIAGFMVAAIIGSVTLLFMYFKKKKTFHIRNLIAGIILGVPNYFSIYFLIKALQNKNLNSSATIPINNIGVLFLVSMFGIFIFKEKLSKMNYIGLLLTLIAIICIFLGDK